MAADRVPTDLDGLRQRHTLTWKSTSDEAWGRPGVCSADGHAWPCDTKIALDALDAAKARPTVGLTVEQAAAAFCEPAHRGPDGWPLVGEDRFCGRCLDRAEVGMEAAAAAGEPEEDPGLALWSAIEGLYPGVYRVVVTAEGAPVVTVPPIDNWGDDVIAAKDADTLSAIIELVSDETRGYRVDAAVLEGLQRVRDRRADVAAAGAGGVSGELVELREMVAFLRGGVVNLSHEELVQRITAVGSAEWRAGNWLSSHDAKVRDAALKEVLQVPVDDECGHEYDPDGHGVLQCRLSPGHRGDHWSDVAGEHTWPDTVGEPATATAAALVVDGRPVRVSRVDRAQLESLLLRVGHADWDAVDVRNVTDHVLAFLTAEPVSSTTGTSEDEDDLDDLPADVIAASLHHPGCNHRTGGPAECDSRALTAVMALRAAGLLPARGARAVR